VSRPRSDREWSYSVLYATQPGDSLVLEADATHGGPFSLTG